jgi:hypothetical protein
MAAIKRYNLARAYSSTTGTGVTVALGAAVPGFLSWTAAGVQANDAIIYCIRDGTHSEVGYGTVNATVTAIDRTTPLKSTNANQRINLSGFAEVFIGTTAEDFGTGANQALLLDDTGKIPAAVIQTSGLWSTGDVKFSISTTPASGWLIMDDQTIGDPSSGAVNQSADYMALFSVLFQSVGDSYAPIYDSAGTARNRAYYSNNWNTAWTAHARLKLVSVLGRALAVAGSGAGLTGRALGQYGGEEFHTLNTGELASHNHNVVGYGDFSSPGQNGFGGSAPTNFNLGTSFQGGNAAHNTIQPTTWLCAHIKL